MRPRSADMSSPVDLPCRRRFARPDIQDRSVAPTPSTRLLRTASLALVLGLGLTVAACGGGGEEKKGETSDAPAASGPTVTVAPAALTSLPRIITASGSISAWEEVPVGAETGGLVATAVYVDEGTYVRQGQPL
eukprot:gene14440-19116_t